METRNITLALPKDLLLKIKLIAVKRETSVSRMLTETLEDIVSQDDAYARSRKRHQLWLREGADLGTYGEINVSRDELHDRG